MCGIVYAQSFDGSPVNNNILQQYDKQKSRGQEGFGLFDGQYMHRVRAAKENKILKWLCKYDSNLIMFHHRYPTSTINVKRAAHPFTTKDYFGDNQYIMVHNGMISNDDDLFEKHAELGIEYQSMLQDLTFNDSEALLWDLALTLEGKQKKLTATGSIAFVCIKLHKGKLSKMYFGRNTSPLNMLRNKNGISLASEGEGEAIDTNTLYTFNYDLKRLSKRHFSIPSTVYSYSKSVNEYKPYVYRGYIEYDYDRNGTPIYNNKQTSWDSYVDEPIQYKPTTTEVRAKAFQYLHEAKGNFEDAYWLVEADYELTNETDNWSNNTREMAILEEVMQYLCLDPDYVDEKSINKLWRTA